MADNDAAVTAPGNLASLTLTIPNLLDGANESLSAEVTGTAITAAYAAGVLTLSGTDTAAHDQQVLRSVRYEDVAANPDLTTRTITAVASDGSLSSTTAFEYDELPAKCISWDPPSGMPSHMPRKKKIIGSEQWKMQVRAATINTLVRPA